MVLVEGLSDQAAVHAVANRCGRDLDADGVSVIPLGGATNIGRFLARFGPQGLDLRLTGLCDAGEERYYQRGLERAGLGADLTRAEMESFGFFVCDADLEDELIRALGVTAVQHVVEAEGEMRLFRSFQRQPAQRERATDRQLRRFIGTLSGRKIRYATSLVNYMDPADTPRPLAQRLAHL